MKILFIGDIFSQTGIRAVKTELPKIRQQYSVDFVIANAENTTNCKGISERDYNELVDAGVNFFTMGNHTWGQNDIYDLLTKQTNIIRPYNITHTHQFGQYGVGTKIVKIKGFNVRITNLIGVSVPFHNWQTNPFLCLNEIIEFDNHESDFHIVDIHAEATSEKNALFVEFQNKVSAIIGTHTHVQTADNKIINNTAYITDVGSTGPAYGVLGASAKNIIQKFKDPSKKLIIQEEVGQYQFCAVLIELDEKSKKPVMIKRILIYEDEIIN